MVIDNGPLPPLKLACKQAFWRLSKTEIQRFCANGGFKIASSASLFDTLMSAVERILGLTGEKALEVVAQRQCTQKHSQAFAEELLQMDAAIEIFDQADRQSLNDDMKGAQSKLDNIEDFKVQLAEARSTVFAAKRQKALKDRPVLPRVMSQEEAAVFAPPSAHVWISNYRTEWWGHFLKYKRVWVPYNNIPGEDSKACIECLQRLWIQHNEHYGYPRDYCLYSGIFPDAEQ